MTVTIRKVLTIVEDTLVEGRRAVPRPFRMVATVAVLDNPWSTTEFVEDLRTRILEYSPMLVRTLIPPTIAAAGGADRIETFGKFGVVGVDGEVEHAAAFIHTLRFGNELRKACGADSFIPFSNTRLGPGSTITVPLKHKMKAEEGSRAHFLSMALVVADAPAPRELIVGVAVASGGRPHHRIGDRFQDMQEMGVDQTGKKLAEG